jgi:hypothetical protein
MMGVENPVFSAVNRVHCFPQCMLCWVNGHRQWSDQSCVASLMQVTGGDIVTFAQLYFIM